MAASTNNDIDQPVMIQDWEWFTDAFDMLDEYDDVLQIKDYNRNKYDDEKLQRTIEEYQEDYDFEQLAINGDEEEMATLNTKKPEVLSQKLSQLSTKDEDKVEPSTTQKRSRSLVSIVDETENKKRRTWSDHKHDDDDNEGQEELEDYLDQLDEIFTKKITDHLANSNIINVDLESIRHLAILQHKMETARLHRGVCYAYLKLGAGEWKTNEHISSNVNRCFWPKNVTSISQKTLEGHMYEKSVQQQIKRLDETILQYKQEYADEKNTSAIPITTDLEQVIEQFVQQFSLIPYESRIQFKMTLLQHEYDNQLISREFLQYNPTNEQVCLLFLLL